MGILGWGSLVTSMSSQGMEVVGGDKGKNRTKEPEGSLELVQQQFYNLYMVLYIYDPPTPSRSSITARVLRRYPADTVPQHITIKDRYIVYPYPYSFGTPCKPDPLLSLLRTRGAEELGNPPQMPTVRRNAGREYEDSLRWRAGPEIRAMGQDSGRNK
eukprot:765077-Hanusia_phi.AAC.2